MLLAQSKRKLQEIIKGWEVLIEVNGFTWKNQLELYDIVNLRLLFCGEILILGLLLLLHAFKCKEGKNH